MTPVFFTKLSQHPERQDHFKAPVALDILDDTESNITNFSFFLVHFILRTRGKYGEGAKQETFTFALTLVFIQCVINAVFAKICEYLDSNLLCAPAPLYPGHQMVIQL